MIKEAMLSTKTRTTKMRPVALWPDINSPAQSFASVIHPTVGSSWAVGAPVLANAYVAFSELMNFPFWVGSSWNEKNFFKFVKSFLKVKNEKFYLNFLSIKLILDSHFN